MDLHNFRLGFVTAATVQAAATAAAATVAQNSSVNRFRSGSAGNKATQLEFLAIEEAEKAEQAA